MKRHIGMLLLLATVGVTAEESAEPVLGVRGVDAASARIMLDAHNGWRRQVDVPDLGWSEILAQSAQDWA
ncbi:MAG: CAP domain-containing protein, partial [Nevskiales bacterium]